MTASSPSLTDRIVSPPNTESPPVMQWLCHTGMAQCRLGFAAPDPSSRVIDAQAPRRRQLRCWTPERANFAVAHLFTTADLLACRRMSSSATLTVTNLRSMRRYEPLRRPHGPSANPWRCANEAEDIERCRRPWRRSSRDAAARQGAVRHCRREVTRHRPNTLRRCSGGVSDVECEASRTSRSRLDGPVGGRFRRRTVAAQCQHWALTQ